MVYPGLDADIEHGFSVLRSLPADIWVTSHARRWGRYRSINYLVFPGVTDTEPELDAFCDFVAETDLDLVQMRNLNIDPELYRRSLPAGTVREGMGIATFMCRLRERFPHLRFGYFNPSKETYASWRQPAGRPG